MWRVRATDDHVCAAADVRWCVRRVTRKEGNECGRTGRPTCLSACGADVQAASVAGRRSCVLECMQPACVRARVYAVGVRACGV